MKIVRHLEELWLPWSWFQSQKFRSEKNAVLRNCDEDGCWRVSTLKALIEVKLERWRSLDIWRTCRKGLGFRKHLLLLSRKCSFAWSCFQKFRSEKNAVRGKLWRRWMLRSSDETLNSKLWLQEHLWPSKKRKSLTRWGHNLHEMKWMKLQKE